MKKQIIYISLMLFLMLAGCASKTNLDKQIGEVNGEAISGSEYDKLVKLQTVVYETQTGMKLQMEKDEDIIKDLQDASFEQLVMDLVLKQEAEKQGISVSDKQVDDAMVNVKASVTEEGYKKMIKDTGLNEDDVRSMVRVEIISQAVQDNIAKNVQINDAQIKEYYQQHQDDYKIEAGMEIFHILVEEESKALEILNNLKNGSDFSALAKENSIDTGSQADGGFVGIANENSAWVGEFKDAALELKAGQLATTPVKSQYGYHIIKAGKQIRSGVKSLADVKEEIKNILKNQQANQTIKELRQKAVVKDLRTQ